MITEYTGKMLDVLRCLMNNNCVCIVCKYPISEHSDTQLLICGENKP